jgi:radical SAM superfamily enzyme YgiQ (UPF0313 family)
MNVLIISTNQNSQPVPVMPVGACMVADATERAGHKAHLVDLMFTKDFLSSIRSAVISIKPDVIGLSIRNIDNNEMKDTVFYLSDLRLIVKTIRDLTGVPIILGGAALGVMPEEILRLADISFGVTGDGGTVFPALLKRIERAEDLADIPGVAYFKDGIFLRNPTRLLPYEDGMVAPDYTRWLNISSYQSQMASASVQTKIGCPFQCIYCTYRKIEGSECRLSDPAGVADAVMRLVAAGLSDIEFVDSVFNEPYDHAMSVCEALARMGSGARFQSLALNPRSFDNALVSIMERAGFVGIGITVESASDAVLQGLRKGFTSREVYYAAEIVQKHHLSCAWIFMFGGPGETQETVMETLRFAKYAIRPQDVAFFNLGIRIYPGTEMETIARNQGTLLSSPFEMLTPVFYVSPDIDIGWMDQKLKRFMNSRMNFINLGYLGKALLPTIHRISYRLGLKPPLWRHTRLIRRGLRIMGLNM